jgi:hypothetical protein
VLEFAAGRGLRSESDAVERLVRAGLVAEGVVPVPRLESLADGRRVGRVGTKYRPGKGTLRCDNCKRTRVDHDGVWCRDDDE